MILENRDRPLCPPWRCGNISNLASIWGAVGDQNRSEVELRWCWEWKIWNYSETTYQNVAEFSFVDCDSISVKWIFPFIFSRKTSKNYSKCQSRDFYKQQLVQSNTFVYLHSQFYTWKKNLKGFWSIFILKTWHISNANGNFTDHWLCFQVIWIAHTSEQTTLTLVI